MKIYARHVFDGERFLANVLIETQDSTIIGVTSQAGPPSDTGATLVVDSLAPGLIDAHTHLVWDGTFESADRVEREGPARTLLRAVEHGRRHLAAGVTTVRDLGSTDGLAVLLGQAVADGLVAGPTILAAGRALGSRGGQAPGLTREVNDPEEAARAAREEMEGGARVIKVMASGGLHDRADRPQVFAMAVDVLTAVVGVAREAGVPVAAHAHHPDVIKPLVRLGVTSVEHGALTDVPTARLMAKHGTVLVPTLAIFDRVASMPGLDAETRGRYLSISHRAQEACRIAAGEGVRIAAGTDSGGPETPHGSVAHELRLLSLAGLDHGTVLAAATSTAAELLGTDDSAGRVAVGRPADLVGLRGDLTTDLSTLENPAWVMRHGRLV